MKKNRINEIWGVGFLLLGLFTLASLFFFHAEDLSFFTSHPSNPIRNVTGVMGAYLAFGLFITFGISAFLIPLLFLLWSGCFFLQNVPERKFFKFLGLGVALMATATMVTISVEPDLRFLRGGALGYLAGSHLLRYFGLLGSYIIAGACFLLAMLLATDFLIYPLVRNLFKRFQKIGMKLIRDPDTFRERFLSGWFSVSKRPRGEGEHCERKVLKIPRESVLPATPLKVKKYDPQVSELAEKLKAEAAREQAKFAPVKLEKPELAKTSKPAVSEGVKTEAFEDKGNGREKEKENQNLSLGRVVGSTATRIGEYRVPPIELLKKPKASKVSTDDLQENSRVLERTLEEFGIEVKVMEVEQGPVITRYELLPAPGVKVNSIASLSDDIALALRAASVRLIIPIPGKSAVGVEIPNLVSSTVSLREMVESQAFQSHRAILPLLLGKSANGEPMIADLAEMPHILIAGSTGSGKTVCVNSIIMGLIYSRTPEELKFVMVDPKMVELAVYNDIPHMLTPVVTDVRKAARTLNWVASEMENRFRLFAACGVRNIHSFNTRPLSEEDRMQLEGKDSENVVPVKLPYIVIVIDELADLMMVARDKVEGVILRLAQLARAVGIHLILATQRPSVDVITGVIKANFPARLCFKVAAKVDSRTVLDTNGADKLIGRGDMLFLKAGEPKPIRGQAPLVVDEEINAVVKFVSEQGTPEFLPEIQNAMESKGTSGTEEKDELFQEAVQIVLETRQASTSNLQRRMRLGYTRAARIIDQMEAEGIVGPQQGARPREILLSPSNTEAVAE